MSHSPALENGVERTRQKRKTLNYNINGTVLSLKKMMPIYRL